MCIFIIKYLLSWRFLFVTSILPLGNCATWKIRDLEQRLVALSLNTERSVNSLLTSHCLFLCCHGIICNLEDNRKTSQLRPSLVVY